MAGIDRQPELHLTDFDGPLEVLLHLIQASKMDIYDIPIAQITKQYMDYIEDARQLNLEIIGDYFVMAAKLMVIKSKMLLPTPDVGPLDEADEDPREDLVAQLINYKKYKQIAEKLKAFEATRRLSYTRSELRVPASKETLVDPSPFNKGDVMASYVDALKHFNFHKPLSTTVHEWQFTIESQTKLIRQLLDRHPSQISFDKVIQGSTKPEEIVTDFLAILEMAKYDEVYLEQKNHHASIEIRKGPAYDHQ